jgi:hypothetical protein
VKRIIRLFALSGLVALSVMVAEKADAHSKKGTSDRRSADNSTTKEEDDALN